jgi:hypothetical protein
LQNDTETVLAPGELTMTSHPFSSSWFRPLATMVVVTRHPHISIIDTVQDAGEFDIVFIESVDRAYSCIKRVAPQLVIICLEVDDPNGFQLLTMLALDGDTAAIPVRTYVLSPAPKGVDSGNVPADRSEAAEPIAAPIH